MAKKKLNKPITMSEISACLGVGSLNLRTLCQSNAVNPKSRYKPVESDYLGPMTDALYKGVNWGYRVPEMVGNTDYRNYIVSGVVPSNWAAQSSADISMGMGWYYRARTQRYRMLDFDGYDHTQSGNLLGELSCSSTSQSTFTVYHSSGIFKYNEFEKTASYHWGIAILTPSNTLWFKSVLDSGGESITLSASEKSSVFNQNGTYRIFGIITAENVSLDNRIGGLIPMPNTELSVSYTSGGGETVQNILVRLEQHGGEWYVYLENNSSSSYTVSNIKVGVYDLDDSGSASHINLDCTPVTLTASAGTTSSAVLNVWDYNGPNGVLVGIKIYKTDNVSSNVKVDYSLKTFYI